MTHAPIDTTSKRILVLAGSTNATTPDGGRVSIPLTMPAAQTYYWSAGWQRAEAESLADYEAGEYAESAEPDEIIRWLDTPETD